MADKKPIINVDGITHELTGGDNLEISGSAIVGVQNGTPLEIRSELNSVRIGVDAANNVTVGDGTVAIGKNVGNLLESSTDCELTADHLWPIESYGECDDWGDDHACGS